MADAPWKATERAAARALSRWLTRGSSTTRSCGRALVGVMSEQDFYGDLVVKPRTA